MGRAPCCDKANVKRGPWSPEEDATLKNYIQEHGTGGNWISLPTKAGLKRCGKSCRLRWLNYLRPDIKHGAFTDEEDNIICTLYTTIGSRWAFIASQLPGRTDNDVKNYWNTKLKKKLLASQIYATSKNSSTHDSMPEFWSSNVATNSPNCSRSDSASANSMQMGNHNYYYDHDQQGLFLDQPQFLPVSYPSSSLQPLDNNGSPVLQDDGTLPDFGFESLNYDQINDNDPGFQERFTTTSPYLGFNY